MDELIRAGYSARRRRSEEEEIELFAKWCEKNGISRQSFTAELSWEKELSELKKQALQQMSREDYY